MLLTTKQSKGKSTEHFFGKLKELSGIKIWISGNQKHTLMRVLFFANMQDHEVQQELPRETPEPPQALRLAMNMNSDNGIKYNF